MRDQGGRLRVKHAALLCVLASLVVGVSRPASGEVRADLDQRAGVQQQTLEIIPTKRGVWTPRASVDAGSLNPQGDLRGDGFPGHASSESAILAAWWQPTERGIALARWDGLRWNDLGSIPAPAGGGTPQVAPVPGGWVVAYQSLGPEVEVVVQLVGPAGPVGERIVLAQLQLIALLDVDGRLHLVARSTTDELLVVTMSHTQIPQIPIPIDWVSQPLGTLDLDRAGAASMPVILESAESAGIAWWDDDGGAEYAILDGEGVASAPAALPINGRENQNSSRLAAALKKAMRP